MSGATGATGPFYEREARMTYTRRRLAAVGTLFLIASLVILSALPALAHTPSIQAKCDGLKVSLTFYNTRYDNSVVVTIDGVVVDSESDFGTTYSGWFPWDDTVSHSYHVVVAAWDDPNGEKGWSFSHQGSQQACRQVTTTTQQETTTTTTQQETTTTTQPEETTTTTQPEETTTTTQPEETTTTTLPEETTTTTLPEETTTTTQPEQTTTTQPERTTTTQPEQTTTSAPATTIGVEVAGIVVSAPVPAQVTQATLPFTGVSSAGLAVIAVSLAGLGVMALGLAKRTEDRAGVRSW